MPAVVFFITTRIPLPRDRGLLTMFFQHPARSVEELHRVLVEEGSIHGFKLDVPGGRGGPLVVRDRQPVVLAEAGVCLIQPCDLPLEEGVEA